MTFINKSGLEFKDISSEEIREYVFPNMDCISIKEPLWLHVSDSGGHRLFNKEGVSWYIPSGWICLTWVAKEGKPNFVL